MPVYILCPNGNLNNCQQFHSRNCYTYFLVNTSNKMSRNHKHSKGQRAYYSFSNHKWPLIPVHSDHGFCSLGWRPWVERRNSPTSQGRPLCTGLFTFSPKQEYMWPPSRSLGGHPRPWDSTDPGSQGLRHLSGQKLGPPRTTGTTRCHLNTGVPRGIRYPLHSPLITSATRRVPVPSRLMTPKHLKGGTTGWPGNNQPQREETPQPHPRSLKTKSLKGRTQAVETASPLGHPLYGIPRRVNPGSSKLLRGPQKERRGTEVRKPTPGALAEPCPASGTRGRGRWGR